MKAFDHSPFARRFAAVVAACAVVATCFARAPSWVRDAMQADISEWSQSSSAVVLLKSESVRYLAPDRVRRELRVAVRILQPVGADHAYASLGYNADTEHVRSARAWIVSPDGGRTDVYEQPQFTDAAASDSGNVWNAERVIAFPGAARLAVGSVFAWEFEVDADSGIFDSSWSFVSSSPVVRSVFSVEPSSGGHLLWHASSDHVPRPSAGPEPGSLVWEMRRLPAPPEDEPKGFQPNPQSVSVRCAPSSTGESDRTWRDLGGRVAAVIEPRIVVDENVKRIANRVAATAPAASPNDRDTSRWARIRVIGRYVQHEIRYLSLTLEKDSLAGYRPHAPADVAQRGVGDCKDKAVLVAALLRSLGDRAYIVLVNEQNPCALSPDWATANFDHAIVAVAADADVPKDWPQIDAGILGKLVPFDPTDDSVPLGVLPLQDQGGYGLVVASEGPGLVPLPVTAPEINATEYHISGTLDGSGRLVATDTETYRGPAGATVHDARTSWREDEFTGWLQKRVASSVPGATPPQWEDRWDEPGCAYRLQMKISADGFSRTVGARMMLVYPRVFASFDPLPPWTEIREGVAWLDPHQITREVRLELPEGFTVAEVPKSWTLDQPRLTCRLDYRIEGREMVFNSVVTRRTGVIERADYESLRNSYRLLDEAERRPVVLTRKPANP